LDRLGEIEYLCPNLDHLGTWHTPAHRGGIGGGGVPFPQYRQQGTGTAQSILDGADTE
jgi:hypothetical protein